METKLIQNNIIITVHFIHLWMAVLSYFINLRMAVLSSFLAAPFPLTWIKHKRENYVQISDKLFVLEYNL